MTEGVQAELRLIGERQGVDLDWVIGQLEDFQVETPSWGYGDSGTRFKVFQQEGVPRNLQEKIADAAQVHKYTGACPAVAIHIPWDKQDDYSAVQRFAGEHGMRIGAVNPNLFQEDCYKYGSVCHPDADVRQQASGHIKECIDVARAVGSSVISLWLADGTNYAGQDSIRRRKRDMLASLADVYGALDDNMRLLLEYKFFEPAFYHTDLADWGMALTTASALGRQAEVLVDMGHHALGTNVAHIVAFLLDEGKIGGFHFNDRRYADDDLMSGTVNPYDLFLVFHEIVTAAQDADTAPVVSGLAYMIDQSHCIEPKIPAMIRSVLNIQTAYAKALLVNREALWAAQQEQDVIQTQSLLQDAFETDVRPLLQAVREKQGLPAEPLRAFLDSGYLESIRSRGVGGTSWS